MTSRLAVLLLVLGFGGPGYAASYRGWQINEILKPFKSCQFVITVESLAHHSPYLLPRIVQELLKYQMEVWESPTFLLQDLFPYSRSRVLIRHGQTCIIHVTFPPKWKKHHYLNFPVFWKGKWQSVNVKKDVVFAFVNAGRNEFYDIYFDPCDYPVNSLIFKYDRNTVNPWGLIRYTTHPRICREQSLCVQGMTPSEGFALISKPYDQLLKAFQQDGKDFHQRPVFTIVPVPLKRECPSVQCMDKIPITRFISDPAIAEFYVFFELAKWLNISGFVDVRHPRYHSLVCTLGAILVDGKWTDPDPRFAYPTFPKVLSRYECYKLVYGDSRTLPSPFKFVSLSEPFMPHVWSALLISCLTASVYVLLRVRSMQLERALGFVLSAWFGNEQRVWLPKPRPDSPGEGDSKFRVFASSVASVGFFLICVYCAYVQTQIITPGTHKSSKNATELLAEGYEMFSPPVLREIFQEYAKHAAPGANTCPRAVNCQTAEYVRHAELGKVLQPATRSIFTDDNFWLLEKKAVIAEVQAISAMFGRLGKRLGRDYFSTKDEYMKFAKWYAFDDMPYSHVVVEVFQRIQQTGIGAWVSQYYRYWYFRKVEGTSGPKTDVAGFAMTDTIIAESFLLFAFGTVMSLAGFLIVEVGVPTGRRLFIVARSYLPIACIKTKANLMRLCQCYCRSDRS